MTSVSTDADRVQGDAAAAAATPNILRAALNSSLYAVLNSIDAASRFALTPGGIPVNAYNGHVFWE